MFKPEYGMFVFDKNETKTWWFNQTHAAVNSSQEEYFFVGLMVGLAIYNDVILNINFPLVVYKKLLGTCPGSSYFQRHEYKLGLEDVKQTFPMIGRNLEFLLEYEGDVESTFEQYFQVSFTAFDKTFTYDLIPNGGSIPVTNENRKLYVEKYVDYLLNVSISKQFERFKAGFMRVCSGPVLKLFRAEELELCICGANESIDTKALEEVCIYRGGYDRHNLYIKEFWDVIHNLDQDKKKQLLVFTTGTDRLPIGGIKSLMFTVQRNGPDTEQIPTAMTCYNVLLLPEYSSKEKLRKKLSIALANYQGFGLL